MEYSIRPLTPADQSLLWEMLYQALHSPTGEPFPREIIQQPELSRYVQNFGRPGDMGCVALLNPNNSAQQPIGAAWLRLFSSDSPGYGYVAEGIPELSIALFSEYRGQGIGSQLLRTLFANAKLSYSAVSLSVSTDNPAIRLYQRFGFEYVSQPNDTWIMVKYLES